MKTIVQVLDARANYMKVAPLRAAFSADPEFLQVIVNTGRHYDYAMAGAFIADLGCAKGSIRSACTWSATS